MGITRLGLDAGNETGGTGMGIRPETAGGENQGEAKGRTTASATRGCITPVS